MLAVLLAAVLAAVGPAGAAGAQAAQERVVYLGFPRGRPSWLLPVRVFVVEGASPYRDVLDLLCRGPSSFEARAATVLPRGSRVDRLTVTEGTATVELRTARPGDGLSRLAIQSVVHTLCQFPEIERVTISVDGRPAGTGVRPDPAAVFPGFPDVGDDPAGGAVLALALRGVFSGYPDGEFRPARPVTRAEALKSLVEGLTLGRVAAAGGAPYDAGWFSDVPVTHWVAPYLREAVRRGLVRQPEEGQRFRPEDPLDGSALVEWLYRAAGEGGGAGAGGTPGTVRETEERLLDRGVLPRDGGEWAARRQVSRGEWAAVLARVLGLGGPDLYVAAPRRQESLEGEVLAAGCARLPAGTVTVGVLDSHGRQMAVREARLVPAGGGTGWGWFAEWLHFPRPLTSSAGVAEVTYRPAAAGEAGVTARVPVFIR